MNVNNKLITLNGCFDVYKGRTKYNEFIFFFANMMGHLLYLSLCGGDDNIESTNEIDVLLADERLSLVVIYDWMK